MRGIFLGHAGWLAEAGGRRILFDPWFAEPVFARAWWRYPPPPFPTAADLGPVDALVVSHIHPDHSGPGTLAQFEAALPVFAMPFATKRMRRRLARFENVTWAEPWAPVRFGDATITFIPHHRGWEVSSIVLEHGGERLYHGNDNTLDVPTYARIARELGPIDLALLPFAGASSYPTGFEMPREKILDLGLKKKAEGIKRFTDGLEGLKPRAAVPFASSWALLEAADLWRNYVDRPTADEVPDAQVMRSGDEWDDGVVARHRADGWGAADVPRYAAQMRDRVAAAHRVSMQAPARLPQAFRGYCDTMFRDMRATIGDLRMTAGFEAGPHRWHMLFAPDREPELRDGPGEVEDETLILTPNDLWTIVAGPENWEDPWYGCRLRVRKREGAGYFRAFWEMLLNFDDDDVSARLA